MQEGTRHGAEILRLTVATFLVLSAQVITAHAEALPLADGAYLPDKQQCKALIANELEMVEFEVSNSGNSYAYPEVSCVAASVTKVRDGRFAVEGDCNEFGDIWQNSFFLDVGAGGSIKLDGRHLAFCSTTADVSLTNSDGWADFQSMPQDTLCTFKVANYAPQYWYLDDSDNDSNIEDLNEIEGPAVGSEVFLLNSQNTSTEVYKGKQLVFVFRGYFAQADSLEFVGDCRPSR
ncbi:hypothetical protein [Devosia naphthalenivorans]|uniref:hypothetical protein n=1 Tax=Devosia naphthalenivorans TaxID=2082392 RepID=UPI000D3D346D|nr:hypothetical protein [Devosia naphthalenivorans]